MPRTTVNEGFSPDLLDDQMRGEIARRNIFFNADTARTGAVVVSPTLGRQGEQMVPGTQVTVPYFGTIGPFERNLADGAALTPSRIRQVTETSAVQRDGKAIEATRWSQFSGYRDPYKEMGRQLGVEMNRNMDQLMIDTAIASGVRTIDHSSDGITWDHIVDAKATAFGDEVDELAVMVVHSQLKRDMMLLKDNDGRPLLVDSMRAGEFSTFAGVPLMTSDKAPLTGSVMGAVTAAGSTPPAVTLAGTPLGPWDLRIECVVGGLSDGTATFRFSTNGGAEWSVTYVVPAGGGAFALNEAPGATNEQPDSLVGFNGETGLTATFANGTYNADNVYEAQANLKPHAMLMMPGSMCYWFNEDAIRVRADEDILRDTDLAAMNIYHVGHRYRRRAGSYRPGIVLVKFQSQKYDGTLEA